MKQLHVTPQRPLRDLCSPSFHLEPHSSPASQTMSRPGYLQNTTMLRVLFIPELLDMIFSYLDASDNAANARVCRRWCDVALDTLWRDVEDVCRLFGLLAPLYLTDAGEQVSFATDALCQPLFNRTLTEIYATYRINRLEAV